MGTKKGKGDIMNLYEAIFVRKTVRKFKMKLMEQSKLDGIMGFAGSIPMLFENLAVEFKIIENVSSGPGVSGPFHVKAPYYLIITSNNQPGYLINAGYLMQQISLYMTSKGIGSCYLGSVKPSREVMEGIKYDYVITLAFGECEHEIYRAADKSRRLPEKDVVIYKEEVNKNIKMVVYAGRLAPSSMNSQPWRFVVYKNRIHIFCKKNVFLSGVLREVKLIDIGICLANMLVTTEELWVECKALRLDNISNLAFKKNDYVISLKIS
jgi:nitroreductase